MADTFLGQSITDMVAQTDQRFFYGLRRTADGELFIAKIDQLQANDSLVVNNEGDPTQNYEDFEQFRWDNRSINYYIDDSGNLVARINEGYTYPTGV